MTDVKIDTIWDSAKRRGAIKTYPEELVFDLSQKEFEKCRFKMINQNYRMVECTVHSNKFSHGFRLHPPHLFDLRDGIMYKKVKGKFVKFVPDFKKNLKNLEESKNETI